MFGMVVLAHCTSSFRSSPSRCPVKDAHPIELPTPRELYRITSYPFSRRGSAKSWRTLIHACRSRESWATG